MNILVIEDNLEVAEFIKDILEEESGFKVKIQADHKAAISLEHIDLILLDENLNGRSGLEYLESLRSKQRNWNGPVIMVTGNDQDGMIRKAFDSGVDDYIVKPFKPLVLVGKIRALSTRCGLLKKKTFCVGSIEIEPAEHKARVNGEEILLTLTEYKILYELAENAGKLVTRDTLKTKVYGDLFVTNRTIDVHICSLRKKLKSSHNCLKTVRGIGYRLLE